MKKYIFTIMIVLSSLFFFGCFTDDEKSASIEGRIEALESAINNHDLEAYIGCFLSSSLYYDTYEQSQFDDKFGGTTYNFGSVVITGDIASCTSTKSTTGEDTYPNTFEMVKDGDEWYIKEWLENGITVWQVPVKK